MAVRVTANEVKAILDDTELSNTIIEAYISSANTLVNAALSSTTLSSSVLKEIERWLSAHMIAATRERTAEEEGAGGAKIKYTGQFGQGLSGTPYGQMVLDLDTTGNMAALGKRAVRMIAIQSFED